jgi:hypothetical protein
MHSLANGSRGREGIYPTNQNTDHQASIVFVETMSCFESASYEHFVSIGVVTGGPI